MVLKARIVVILEELVTGRGHEGGSPGVGVALFLNLGACFVDAFFSWKYIKPYMFRSIFL